MFFEQNKHFYISLYIHIQNAHTPMYNITLAPACTAQTNKQTLCEMKRFPSKKSFAIKRPWKLENAGGIVQRAACFKQVPSPRPKPLLPPTFSPETISHPETLPPSPLVSHPLITLLSTPTFFFFFEPPILLSKQLTPFSIYWQPSLISHFQIF